MSEEKNYPQLQMILPNPEQWKLTVEMAAEQTPAGYHLRTYQAGDEARFYEVMDLVGWKDWSDETLKPWLHRMVPDGWFMAVDENGQIAATTMTTHDHTWLLPYCGEVGWVACDPAHQGRGLGMSVVGASTARFIERGYRNIHLYTEYWRLPAVKTYFKLGFVPYVNNAEAAECWEMVCGQVNWLYTPEAWEQACRPIMGEGMSPV